MASRFLEGQWRDDNPMALFRKSMFKYREQPAWRATAFEADQSQKQYGNVCGGTSVNG